VPPPNLAEIGKRFRETISGNGGAGSDSMIAEMLKMALPKEVFGEKGKDRECVVTAPSVRDSCLI